MPDDNREQIDELIAMLDSFMSGGGGHMNIIFGEDGITQEKVVETFRSADCGTGNLACRVPTLHKGFDDEEPEDDPGDQTDEWYGLHEED